MHIYSATCSTIGINIATNPCVGSCLVINCEKLSKMDLQCFTTEEIMEVDSDLCDSDSFMGPRSVISENVYDPEVWNSDDEFVFNEAELQHSVEGSVSAFPSLESLQSIGTGEHQMLPDVQPLSDTAWEAAAKKMLKDIDNNSGTIKNNYGPKLEIDLMIAFLHRLLSQRSCEWFGIPPQLIHKLVDGMLRPRRQPTPRVPVLPLNNAISKLRKLDGFEIPETDLKKLPNGYEYHPNLENFGVARGEVQDSTLLQALSLGLTLSNHHDEMLRGIAHSQMMSDPHLDSNCDKIGRTRSFVEQNVLDPGQVFHPICLHYLSQAIKKNIYIHFSGQRAVSVHFGDPSYKSEVDVLEIDGNYYTGIPIESRKYDFAPTPGFPQQYKAPVDYTNHLPDSVSELAQSFAMCGTCTTFSLPKCHHSKVEKQESYLSFRQLVKKQLVPPNLNILQCSKFSELDGEWLQERFNICSGQNIKDSLYSAVSVSLFGTDNTQLFLKRLVDYEFLVDFSFMNIAFKDVPQQTDSYSCGIHMLQSIESILKYKSVNCTVPDVSGVVHQKRFEILETMLESTASGKALLESSGGDIAKLSNLLSEQCTDSYIQGLASRR